MKRLSPLFTPLVAVAPLALASCWPGWDFIFDQTPSREHRVEDLRVLAVFAEPASILMPAAFLFDAEPAPIELDVTALAFDPRGGDIDWSVNVCVSLAGPFGAFDCVTPDGAPRVGGIVTAGTDELGKVEVPARVTLGRKEILALFEAGGADLESLEGISIEIVTNVSRTFDGRPERERAVLRTDIRLDIYDEDLDEDRRAAILAAGNGVDCVPLFELEDPFACFPPTDVIPECGNGVVEPGEDCDPPSDEDLCDESCFSFDFCNVAPQPVCVAHLPQNVRPTLEGLVVSDTPGFPDVFSEPVVEVGGVIEITPGESVFVFPKSPEVVDLLETGFQSARFQETGCPEGTPAREGGGLDCAFAESNSFRVYVGDAKAELTSPADENGNYFGNQGNFEAVGVTFVEGTASGTQESLVIVLADGHGGMDLGVFVIEAR